MPNHSTDPSHRSVTAQGMPVPSLSVFESVAVVARRWKALTFACIAGAVLALAVTMLGGLKFTAQSRFTPQGRQVAGGQWAGLAAQFNLTLPSFGGEAESPAFYAAVLVSRELLRELVLTRFPAERVPELNGGSLIEFYGLSADDPDGLNRAIDRAANGLAINTDLRTGIVTLQASAHSSALSLAVNQTLLVLLSDFNLVRRRTQAKAEREFIERRLGEARDSLRASEQSLERFLQENRSYQNSPALTFQAQRLQRTVDLQQQLYTTLAQSYERARIEEVRNTPIITVVDQPSVLRRRVKRTLAIRGLLGCLAGGLGLALWAVVVEAIRREGRADQRGYESLQRALRRDAPMQIDSQVDLR